MSGLADLHPRGDKPPRYIYKLRRGGLGRFSRLRKNSRGVYPTAGTHGKHHCKRDNTITIDSPDT